MVSNEVPNHICPDGGRSPATGAAGEFAPGAASGLPMMLYAPYTTSSTAAVARLDDAIGAEHDQPADTVDLRLDREPVGVTDRSQETAATVIRD